MIRWTLFVSLSVAALYGLHRMALWAEARGLTFYRKAGSGGSLGHAIQDLQTTLEPCQRHVVEERRAERDEGAEAGGPPEPATKP